MTSAFVTPMSPGVASSLAYRPETWRTAVSGYGGDHRKAHNLQQTNRSAMNSSNENTVDLYSAREYFRDWRAGTPAELADRERKNVSISL